MKFVQDTFVLDSRYFSYQSRDFKAFRIENEKGTSPYPTHKPLTINEAIQSLNELTNSEPYNVYTITPVLVSDTLHSNTVETIKKYTIDYLNQFSSINVLTNASIFVGMKKSSLSPSDYLKLHNMFMNLCKPLIVYMVSMQGKKVNYSKSDYSYLLEQGSYVYSQLSSYQIEAINNTITTNLNCF